MMIEAWRQAWGDPGLPFFYVELANHRAPQETPVSAEEEHHWGPIREAQAVALGLPNVVPVSTIDLGEADEIHYASKQAVGQRLARAALGSLYNNVEAPWLSPRYESHAVEGAKIRIRLHDADSLKTDDGKSPAAFAIRGADTEWQWAETAIDGRDILAWHPDIKEPVAVRHAWASNPDVNVYNAAGLPLMPFRTDQSE
jgi:sialate O-acetylesterase